MPKRCNGSLKARATISRNGVTGTVVADRPANVFNVINAIQ